jgi:pimeloyl-ACP methyl ester carboxylesterase
LEESRLRPARPGVSSDISSVFGRKKRGFCGLVVRVATPGRVHLMAFEDIDGMRVSVDCSGSGTPVLIFVHGGFCDRHDWNAQIRALTPRFRVVAFDLPGHGESAPPAEASVAALGQALRGVNERYGGGRAVLIGHSLGVNVILEAVRQSISGIAGMVLIEGGLVADGDPDRAVATFKQKLDTVGFHAFIHAAFGEMFTPESDPQFRRHVLERLGKLDSHFAKDVILSKIHWDASQAARVLANVTVPVLLLQSTYFDETFKRRSLESAAPTPFSDLVMRQVPDAELCFVPGVGHFPQIEAAESVNKRISEFADRFRPDAA